jgi:hypothetical protein
VNRAVTAKHLSRKIKLRILVSFLHGGGNLRGIPVKMALKLGGANFAAGECHGLKNPLVPKSRILILLLRDTVALARIFLVGVPVLFSHKQE